MLLNERIKEQRRISGLTLKEAADRIGISEATMQRYESGGITNVPYEAIEKLARLFDVTPGFLMGWEPADNFDFAGAVRPLTDEEKRLLRAYRNALQGRREAVRALLNMDMEEI